jgi:hypothetical protein
MSCGHCSERPLGEARRGRAARDGATFSQSFGASTPRISDSKNRRNVFSIVYVPFRCKLLRNGADIEHSSSNFRVW